MSKINDVNHFIKIEADPIDLNRIPEHNICHLSSVFCLLFSDT